METLKPGHPIHRIPWLRLATAAAGALALAAFAPVLWLAAAGGAGLIALGILLAIAFAAVQTLPLLGQKLENALLAARKAEARRNPIEQLQNEMLRRASRLQAFRQALVKVGAQIESIEHMVAERRHKDPGHELRRQQDALRRLQQFQRLNLGRLKEAQTALEEFRFTVERKESEWRIALAIDEATELMDPHAADHLMQDLLTDASLRSVQERFNAVFAELDVQMSSMDSPTRRLLDTESLGPMEALELPTVASPRSPS